MLETIARRAFLEIERRDSSFRIDVTALGDRALTYDPETRTLSTATASVRLSESQGLLLTHLESQRRVWAAEELAVSFDLETLVGVRARVHRTRLAIERALDVSPIQTLVNQGYRWNPAYELVEV